MKKKGRVYRKIYISYLMMFTIPIILSVVFYFYVYNRIQKKTIDYNQNILEIVKSESDREMKAQGDILVRLAFDVNLQMLSSVRGEFGQEDSYYIYSLRNELYHTMTFNHVFSTYCKDIFVYFKNSDKIVSAVGGAMDFESYYDLYCRNSAFPKEKMAQYMSGFHYRDTILIEAGEEGGDPYLLTTMTNLKGEVGEPTALIGLKVDIQALNFIIDAIKGENGTEVLILDPDNRMINSTIREYDLDYKMLQEGEAGEVQSGGKTYITQSADSARKDWKFVALTPEKEIGELAIHIRNVFLLGMFGCLFMGLLVSRRMTGSVYVFWEDLLELLRPHRKKGEEEENDEYASLYEQVVRLLEEHADYKQIVSSDRKIVKQYYLTRLLETPYDDQEPLEERDEVSMNLKEGVNRVLLLRMVEKRENNQTTEDFASENSLWKFIISNVFTESLSENFKAEAAEVGDAVAIIINAPQESEENQTRLNEIVDFLQTFLQDKLNFRVIVLMGRTHKGLLGINQSYMEAKAAEGYIGLLEEDYILYDDIRSSSRGNYDYSMEMENKIIAAMKSANPQLAVSYVNHILNVNYLDHKISPMMFKCLLFDIMGTIMKCGDDAAVKNEVMGLVEELDMKNMSVKISLEEIKDRIEALIKSMCPEEAPEKAEGKAAVILADRVKLYIDENYHDPDLNISQAGIYFKVTPPYLSAVFKKQTGMSLLKYMNEVRIREAEKLLKSGVSVADTAARVGFRDSSTFIRVFKKMTGVTPGQLKA